MSHSWARLWLIILMWTSVKWGMISLVVATLFTATLTWPHVVVQLRVFIVETVTSLMETDCHSLVVLIEFRQDQRVELRRTTSTAMGPTGLYFCDIAVHSNGMRETVYVGLYASDKGTAAHTSFIAHSMHSYLYYTSLWSSFIVKP